MLTRSAILGWLVLMLPSCSRSHDHPERPWTKDVVRFSAGSFRGVSTGCRAQERGASFGDVDLTNPPYAIDKHQVSCSDYEGCVDAGKCRALTPYKSYVPPIEDMTGDERGLEGRALVSLGDAKHYCEYRQGRLPSSVEWQRAVRGTKGMKMPRGLADADPTCTFKHEQPDHATFCGYTNTDGVDYTTWDAGQQEFLRDDACRTGSDPAQSIAMVVLSGDRLNDIHATNHIPGELGLFRCSYE